MEQDENNKKLMDKTNELASEMFKEIFKPVRCVYVDLECFQDYDLGALLNLIGNEKEYRHILENIDTFSERLDKQVIKYFPELKYSDEDIKNFISNKKNWDVLSLSSPMTSIYNSFPGTIAQINIHNKQCEQRVDGVKFILNNNRFPLHWKMQESIQKGISTLLPSSIIEFTNEELETKNKEFLKYVDIYFLNDIIKFCQHENTSKFLISDGMFREKRIFATPAADREFKSDKELNTVMNATQTMLDVFCEFSFVQRKILTEEIINGG